MRHLALLTVAIALLLMLYGGWPVSVKVQAAPSDPRVLSVEWMNSEIRKTTFDDGVDCYEKPRSVGQMSCVRRTGS